MVAKNLPKIDIVKNTEKKSINNTINLNVIMIHTNDIMANGEALEKDISYPLCEKCKDDGRLTPAEEVHHIIALSQGGTHSEDNLMSLCKSCHSKITAKERIYVNIDNERKYKHNDICNNN